jgi:aminopeptidase N
MLTLLRQLVTTATLYVAPAKREATLSKVASGLIELAEKAEPGSDSQLQFTKYVPQFARTSVQLDWMESLLSGTKSLKGLEIDQDVRWELLIGLVIGGRQAESNIAAELKRDNTANGQKFASAARAAIPTAAGKAEAWRLLTETEEYSNTLVNAASLAFGRVNDTKLLEPYMDKYLSNAERLWDERSYHIAAYLLNNLYPIQLANQALADKTRALIDTPAFVAKPALRRILVEGLAGLERGLKAQQVDS